MKIIYIGYAINKEKCDYKGVSIAGNNFQLGFLEALSKIDKNLVQCITIYPIATFPVENKVFIKEEEETLYENLNTINIGFINIRVLKEITIFINTYRSLNKILRGTDSKDIAVITYNYAPNIAKPLMILDKKYNYKKVCLLVDPPLLVSKSKNKLKYILCKIWMRYSKSLINKYDKIIALNKNAINEYSNNLENLIIDCGIKEEKYIKRKFNKTVSNSEKKLVFAGTLHDHSGILNLIEAMSYVKDKSAKLYIYGSGPHSEKIKKISTNINNIEFMGLVSNDKIKEILSDAYLLINPSDKNHEINNGAFPSKLMEYMISGTPVISTKLECISEEYNDVIYYFSEYNPMMMAKDIDTILSLKYDELIDKANDAVSFILNNKTWDIQAKKIYNFIREDC